MSQESQNELILKHLESGKRITGLDALRLYGVSHLPRRILDLKEKGHSLEAEWIIVPKAHGGMARVKQWRLAG